MATIIAIETSTEVCSAALAQDGKVIWHKEHTEGMAHATLLAPYLQEMQTFMKAQNLKADAVAVSSGPGSYTGLRIGVSTAKGLCYGANLPLIAIDTLQLMASAAQEKIGTPHALFCPMIDARRMEVYTAFFDHQLNKVKETSADIITEESYQDMLNKGEIYFFGNGSGKCKETLTHANAHFLDGIVPLASHIAPLAEEAYKKGDFKDVAYFEPAYLKEFIATVAKNKVI